MTTRPEMSPTPPRTRRALLAGALGGLTTWAAAAAARADPTAAAVGDPIRMGQVNEAGSTRTTLKASSGAAALRVVQVQDGAGVVAKATNGDAVRAVGSRGAAVRAFSATGTAVDAYSRTGIGIVANSEKEDAVRAYSPDHAAVRAQTDNDIAIRAISSSARSWAGVFEGNVRMTEYVEMQGQVNLPSSPPEGSVRLFVRLSAGKVELCVEFFGGYIIVLAAQP
jgi:hypothetical protein